MGMGIISDQELEAELKRNGVDRNKEKTPEKESHPVERGRKEGDVNVPESLRKVIAEESITNGRASALELAASLGISSSSVSAYKNGSNSTTSYHARDPKLLEHGNAVREKIAGKARRRLLSALHEITPEKLEKAKLKDISGVARDMAAIVKIMEPPQVSGTEVSQKVQVVLYSPQRKNESDFEVINVTE